MKSEVKKKITTKTYQKTTNDYFYHFYQQMTSISGFYNFAFSKKKETKITSQNCFLPSELRLHLSNMISPQTLGNL